MDLLKKHLVKPGASIKLASMKTVPDGPFEGKDDARNYCEEIIEKLREMQYRLFVEAKQSLLIVLQAPDAAGKDGLIRKMLGRMNPQGVRTYPFKVPTPLEKSHDFLWRVHKCTPATGMISVFNRSHYEDILAVRVEKLAPKEVWSKRYDMINHFENLLAANGTRILKFYLHISPEEQLERFKERLDRPEKHWKLNAGDYESRDKRPAYLEAYEDVFKECSPKHAPWFIIPADKKWYRDAAVGSIVYETMKEMSPQLPPVDVDLDKIRRLYEREKAELEKT
ncbi:Polyphosphate kinase 2 (PPK2) [Novipirellula aureliae]|uniref:Polyphosphate kinase 2 (PPK2) n=1 Tax=Novipirellula aureliae TaxID=2527966 RepID=A0A5C6E2U2_9BACT|nr:PPK2 family polyphosphate kinase [Novipirellula aureliae]TWU43178.1 Polyphosphate kinase 2 (PPK2) [Novipirellula aureliae]